MYMAIACYLTVLSTCFDIEGTPGSPGLFRRDLGLEALSLAIAGLSAG